MANSTVDSGAASASPDLPLFARLVGVITAPKATYQSIVAHPKFLGMLLLTLVVSCVLVGGFLFTKVGQEAWLDTVIRPGSPPEQEATMLRIAPFAAYFAIGWIAVFIPLLYLIVSAILYVVFNAALGGNATFKQVFAVATHAGALGRPGAVLHDAAELHARRDGSATNLAVLLPYVTEESFLGRLLGTIDLFLIWRLLVLAIGLGVLYRKRTQPIAITLFVVYAVVALIVAAVGAALGGRMTRNKKMLIGAGVAVVLAGVALRECQVQAGRGPRRQHRGDPEART